MPSVSSVVDVPAAAVVNVLSVLVAVLPAVSVLTTLQ